MARTLASLAALALLAVIPEQAAADFAPSAAPPSAAPTLAGAPATVVVSATRAGPFDPELPVSESRLDTRALTEGELEVNLSETLDEVPGVVAQNRQNYAQDLQVSVRGFGARSEFGVRGVRLYSDGIPGTMPDGQGQFSQFDLGSAAYLEVLRGPFSALYGNSSGGVIAIFTEDGPPGFALDGRAEGGSLGTQRYALKGGGDTGAINYLVDLSHFQTAGYREHSDAERNLLNSKLRFDVGDRATLKLIVNAIETPFIQDPLGLTQAQRLSDPTQAGIGALPYNTRKSLSQIQSGLAYLKPLGAAVELSATPYVGHRHTIQYQAIPAATEVLPTNPGGVIDLEREYWGTDVHATAHLAPGGERLEVTAGASYDRLNESHRSFLNFIGPELGVAGAPRLDEANRVFDFDQYLEAEWAPLSPLLVTVGVRNSTVDVASTDLRTAGDPVTGVHYGATNPVGGLTWRLRPRLDLYAAYGKGFETPTLNDLQYRSTNGSIPGLNFALRSARSDHYELGLKDVEGPIRGSFAVFSVRTHDELAVEQNSNGRSVDENIGLTERRGAELALDAALPRGFSTHLAYTYLRALVAEPYTTCAGTPCLPAVVPAGAHLPAVPENTLYGGLTWRSASGALATTFEALDRAAIFANDLNTAAAPAYWVANWRATFSQQSGPWRFHESAHIDNLADHRYIGTVIVNEANSRYFEPSPGRLLYVMFEVAH